MTLPRGTLAVPVADQHAVEAIAAFGRFASARGWIAAIDTWRDETPIDWSALLSEQSTVTFLADGTIRDD